MKKIILAYLAGVIDSDGCIGIKRNTYSMRVIGDSAAPTYSERVHIRQVEPHAIDLLVAIFGGSRRVEDPSAKRGRPLFSWNLTDKKATACLKALLPYLRIKRAQAENCLNLRTWKTVSAKTRVAKGRGHVGAARRTPAISDAMQACYMHAKALNHVGV